MERICTEVAFLHNGKIAIQEPISELQNKRTPDGYTIETANKEAANHLTNTFSELRHQGHNTLIFNGSEDQFFAVMKYIANRRISIVKIEQIEPTLEALFLEVTK